MSHFHSQLTTGTGQGVHPFLGMSQSGAAAALDDDENAVHITRGGQTWLRYDTVAESQTYGNAVDNPNYFFAGNGTFTGPSGLMTAGADLVVTGELFVNGDYARFGEAAGDPSVVANFGYVYCRDVGGETELFFRSDAGIVQITDGGAVNGGGGVTDHGALDAGSLLDDDHTQYALLGGRTAGQLLAGSTSAGGSLAFWSTVHATRGPFLFEGLTTSDRDVDLRFQGGDGTNRIRWISQLVGGAGSPIWFDYRESDFEGDANFALADFEKRIGTIEGGSVLARQSSIGVYGGDGSVERSITMRVLASGASDIQISSTAAADGLNIRQGGGTTIMGFDPQNISTAAWRNLIVRNSSSRIIFYASQASGRLIVGNRTDDYDMEVDSDGFIRGTDNVSSAGDRLRVRGGAGGGANQLGGPLELHGGPSTGDVDGAQIQYFASPAGASGSGANDPALIGARGIAGGARYAALIAEYGGSHGLFARSQEMVLTSSGTSTIEFPDQCFPKFVLVRIVAEITGPADVDVEVGGPGIGNIATLDADEVYVFAVATDDAPPAPVVNKTGAGIPVLFAPNGGAFTGGTVHVEIIYEAATGPTS